MVVDLTYLFLGEVGNVTGHRSSDNEAASLSLSEMQTASSGAVVNTGQIGLNDFVPLLDWCIEDTTIGGPAGIGNEDINLAEIFDDICDELLHLFVAANVALVCLRLDAELLLQLFGILLTSLRARGVCDGNIGTKFSTSSGGLGTDTCGTRCTGDDDDLALQAEEIVEGGRFGNRRHVGGLARNLLGAGYLEVELRMIL